MKPEYILHSKRDKHLIKMKSCVDTSPTQCQIKSTSRRRVRLSASTNNLFGIPKLSACLCVPLASSHGSSIPLWYNGRHHDTLITRKWDGKPKITSGQFVVACVGVHWLSVFPNISHPVLQIRRKLLYGRSTDSLNSLYKKTTQAVKNHSPHYSRKRRHFGTGYRKTPPPTEKKGQWGPGGLQAWSETVSWWESITVLERARLVWTSLAA